MSKHKTPPHKKSNKIIDKNLEKVSGGKNKNKSAPPPAVPWRV